MLVCNKNVCLFICLIGLLSTGCRHLPSKTDKSLLPASSGERFFRAACVKVDITPAQSQWLLGYGPRQSDGVRDKIYHRIVAMDDGRTQLFLISTDIAEISPSFYHEFCRELNDATGIKEEHIWWTVTHTHSAPEVGPAGLPAIFLTNRYHHQPNPEYSKWIKEVLIEGVKQAQSKLEPARLGVGLGRALANISRREKAVNGAYRLGVNPYAAADRQIGLIRLEHPDGSPIALIANYAIHGTAIDGDCCKISGDVPGFVAEYVEKKIGAPMLFINGACGDMAPICLRQDNIEDRYSVILGDKILDANKSIKTTSSEVTLRIGKTIIQTHRREGLGWVDELADYSRTTNDGVNLVRIPVYFLNINKDTVVWAAPLELFCQIAMNIRNESTFPFTFYFGLTNGTLLYLPTKEAFTQGGYEPKVSPFTAQAEDDFTKGVTAYLKGKLEE
jgi:neutral ceramidase